jgi:hypothetical protein
VWPIPDCLGREVCPENRIALSWASGLFSRVHYNSYTDMNQLPIITLRQLMIDKEKCIGLQYHHDSYIERLLKEICEAQWSDEYRMSYVLNTVGNLNLIFKTFKGIAWINCRYFSRNKPLKDHGYLEDFTSIRNYNASKDHMPFRIPMSICSKLSGIA